MRAKKQKDNINISFGIDNNNVWITCIANVNNFTSSLRVHVKEIPLYYALLNAAAELLKFEKSCPEQTMHKRSKWQSQDQKIGTFLDGGIVLKLESVFTTNYAFF